MLRLWIWAKHPDNLFPFHLPNRQILNRFTIPVKVNRCVQVGVIEFDLPAGSSGWRCCGKDVVTLLLPLSNHSLSQSPPITATEVAT